MHIEFTNHAEEMLKERKITKDEAELAIKSPEKVYKEEGKYYASKNIGRGIIEAVYEIQNYSQGRIDFAVCALTIKGKTYQIGRKLTSFTIYKSHNPLLAITKWK